MKPNSILLSLVMLMVGIIISCTTSEPAPAPPASPLAGTWKQVSSVITNCTNPSNNQALTNCTSCETVTVIGNQITFSKPGQMDRTFPFTIDGTTISYSDQSTSPPVITTGTFVVTSTTLTLTLQDAGTNCLLSKNYTKA
jgi:hypothetical protein